MIVLSVRKRAFEDTFTTTQLGLCQGCGQDHNITDIFPPDRTTASGLSAGWEEEWANRFESF